MNRYLLVVIHIISLFLLALGWVKDMLHINIGVRFMVDINLFDEKRSVFSTLQTLWQTGNYWPFLLIFLFGIIVPIVKSGIIFYLLLAKKPAAKYFYYVNSISKWAMGDVFVISIFIAFLSANAMEHTKANLEIGFYFFSGYVLLSSTVATLLSKMIKASETSTT